MWYDVTQGFGLKWKNFFLELEINHHFDPSNPAHIWLLHHLFLASIQQDAEEWAESWNSHQLTFRGEPARSPRDMFFFSIVQDGPRGLFALNPPEDEPENIEEYGIDWRDFADPMLMAHHLEHNPQAWEEQNPFQTGPHNFSDVPCEPPNCPFDPPAVASLNAYLHANVDLQSRSMEVRRVVWVKALEYCTALAATQLHAPF